MDPLLGMRSSFHKLLFLGGMPPCFQGVPRRNFFRTRRLGLSVAEWPVRVGGHDFRDGDEDDGGDG